MLKKLSNQEQIRRGLTEGEKAWAKLFSNYGFAHAFIASQVYHKPAHRLTDREIHRVAGYLIRNGAKVTDYRKGVSATAKMFAQQAKQGIEPNKAKSKAKPKKRKFRLKVA